MKVLWFNGNLGNQVFYCKYVEYIRQQYPDERIKYYWNPKHPKVRVEECFHLTVPERTNSIIARFMFEVMGRLFGSGRMPLKYVPKWFCTQRLLNPEATWFDNYFQDKSYFENEDSSWLQIRKPQSFPNGYIGFEEKILSSNSVTVHVRRGDYIGTGFVDLSATDYYEKAMAKAKEIYPDAQFFFFSDDLDFVKERFKGDNIHYVDCNRGADSYLDMLLMSQAKVNIIANSTFSYWGAYMGHEHKTVICPKVWYRINDAAGRKAPDIMFDRWMNI